MKRILKQKNNQERLSHDEVFKAIRSSLKDTTNYTNTAFVSR